MASPLRLAYTEPVVADPTEQLARSIGARRAALGPFGQGLVSGSEGLVSGTAQYLSDASELIGLDPTTLRGIADERAAGARTYAPAIQSYKQVEDVPTAIDFGLGLIGQGIPSVAAGVGGAVAGRSLLRNPWGAPAGAAAAMFPLEAGETARTLAEDPNTRTLPVGARVELASRKGAINAGIETLGAPASIVGGLGRRAAKRGVAREVAAQVRNEALTEGAQEAVGLAAHSVADPSRNTAGDIEQVINAMIGGGLLGGGLGAAGGAVNSALSQFERVPGALQDAADRLSQGDGHASLRGATIEETLANLKRADPMRPDLAAAVLQHPDVPEAVRQQFAGADFSTPEAQADLGRAIGAYHTGQRARKALGGLVTRLKGMLPGGSPGGSPGEPAPKQSRMRAPTPLLQTLVRHMKPEVRGDGEIVRALPDMARGLHQVLNEDNPNVTLDALRRFVNSDEAHDVFADPGALTDELIGMTTTGQLGSVPHRLAASRVAEGDVGKTDSVLVSNLTQAGLEMRTTALRRLAQAIDDYNIRGPRSRAHQAAFDAAMKEAFGPAADFVRDFYTERHRDQQTIYAPQELLEQTDEGTADYEAEQQGTLSERDERPMRRYADPMRKLPYAKGGAVKDKALIEGAIGRGAKPAAVPFSNVVADEGFEPETGLRRLLAGLSETKDETLRAAGERARQLYEKTGNAKRALDEFEVLEISGYDEDPFVASDEDLQTMRKLVGVARNTKDKEKADDAKKTLITFIRRSRPNEKTTLGKEFKLSAESMWKTWQKKFPGQQTEGEVKPEYVRRMFEEALSAVLARDDILGTGVAKRDIPWRDISAGEFYVELGDNLLLDRATGVYLYKGPGKGFTSLPEWERVGDKIVEKGRKQNGPLAAIDEEVNELVAAIDGISVEPDDRIDQQELVRIQNEADSIEGRLFAVQKQLQDALAPLRSVKDDSEKLARSYKAWSRRLDRLQPLFDRVESAVQRAQTAYEGPGVVDNADIDRAGPEPVRTYEEDTGVAIGRGGAPRPLSLASIGGVPRKNDFGTAASTVGRKNPQGGFPAKEMMAAANERFDLVDQMGRGFADAEGAAALRSFGIAVEEQPTPPDAKERLAKIEGAAKRYYDYLATPPKDFSYDRARQIKDWAASTLAQLQAVQKNTDQEAKSDLFFRLEDVMSKLAVLPKMAADVIDGEQALAKMEGKVEERSTRPDRRRDEDLDPHDESLDSRLVRDLKADVADADVSTILTDDLLPLEAMDVLEGAGFKEVTPGTWERSEPALVRDTHTIDMFESQSSKYRGIGAPLTQDEKDVVVAELLKTRGAGLRVVWDNSGLFEGEYTYQAGLRTIKIAANSLHPMETAWHESLHDFMRMLLKDGKRALRENLMAVASQPGMKKKLHDLLQGYPEAQKQLSDPEEALAYMFQFWAAGKLTIPTQARNWFQKIAEFFRGLLGVLSREEQAVQILSAFKSGRFADVNTTAAALDTMRAETLTDRVARVAGPVKVVADKLLDSAVDRLTNSGIPQFKEIASAFHQNPGLEGAPIVALNGTVLDLPFLQRRAKQSGQWINKLTRIIDGATREELTEAIISLQAHTTPTSERARRVKADVRQLLDEMHAYLARAGVADLRKDAQGNWVWRDIGQVQDYFPRIWSPEVLRARRDEFLALMNKYTDPESALAIYNTLSTNGGQMELAENESHLGFSPYMQGVKNRRLTFIKRDNAHEFMPFMEKDLVQAMSTYIFQGVHRAEYTRQFGNDGEWIRNKLKEAKAEGATQADLTDAAKTVRALEGTLNHDFSPQLRQLFSSALVYENIALLPFALFSSLIDPLGIAVRTGDLKEAWNAFKGGMQGIVDAFKGTEGKDAETELARLIGIIDERNVLENVGSLYNGMYMSPFLRKVNDAFFKWNGMELWNRRMRVAATAAAQRFLIKHARVVTARTDALLGDESAPPTLPEEEARSQRYMDELGVKPGDILPFNDGIALTKDQVLLALQAHLGGRIENAALEREAEKISERVQAAVFKFVDSAILRPTSAHRPVWGSDPAWALVFHLKQFTFSFHNTILKRASHEFSHGNRAPLFMLASYVPFMIAADFLRGGLTGARTGWDLIDWLANGVDRSGILGTGTFFSDALQDASRGTVPGASFLGPTAGHVIDAIQTIAGAPTDSFSHLVHRSLPAGPVFKAVGL